MNTENRYRRNLRQLADSVLLMCGDPNGERFEYERVFDVLNHVCIEACLKNRIIIDSVNIVLRTDRIHYDIKSECVRKGHKQYGYPLRVAFGGMGKPAAFPMSLTEIDLCSYSQIGGDFQYCWHVDSVSPGKIAIFGKPQTDGYSDTGFATEATNGLIRGIAADGEYLPFDAPPNTALRDIQGPVSFRVIRNMGKIITELVGISEENNMQVTYCGLPDEMTSGDSYPDTAIPLYVHEALIFGAASRLLEEGNSDDLARAAELNREYIQLVMTANQEQYRGLTAYDSCEPA